jgi:hypothetical protein
VQRSQPLEWLKGYLALQHDLPARPGPLQRGNAKPNAKRIPRDNTHPATHAYSKSNTHPVANTDAFAYAYAGLYA